MLVVHFQSLDGHETPLVEFSVQKRSNCIRMCLVLRLKRVCVCVHKEIRSATTTPNMYFGKKRPIMQSSSSLVCTDNEQKLKIHDKTFSS